jgi:hypothetical protein
MTLELQGVVALPTPLLVAPDALGQPIPGATEVDQFELVLPALPDPVSTDWHWLMPPRPDLADVSQLVDEHEWGQAGYGVGLDGDRPLASWVNWVVILATADTTPPPSALGAETPPNDSPDVAHRFGNRFTRWFRKFAAWIELWTPLLVGEPLSSSEPLRGQVYAHTGEGRHLTGWGLRGGSVTMQRSSDAATIDVLLSAASRASKGELPPLEWQLLRKNNRDRRQTLIDVATAAEVAMAKAIRSRLGSIPGAAQELIVQNANGAAGLIRLLEQIDIDTGKTLRNRVMSRLAEPRNLAAHAGVIPTRQVLDAAIEQAYDVVEKYSPPPTPDEA